VQSIFDLDFSFGRTTKTPTKPFNSQGGFNVHTIVLNIPLSQLSGAKMAGVYATTSHWDADHDQLIQVGLAGTPGFNRLGVFGGDVLHSTVQDPFGNGGFIPGGWPNGRRFGDDVANIGLIAVGAAGPFRSIDPNFNGSRIAAHRSFLEIS
jgi:hypothetical protein